MPFTWSQVKAILFLCLSPLLLSLYSFPILPFHFFKLLLITHISLSQLLWKQTNKQKNTTNLSHSFIKGKMSLSFAKKVNFLSSWMQSPSFLGPQLSHFYLQFSSPWALFFQLWVFSFFILPKHSLNLQNSWVAIDLLHLHSDYCKNDLHSFLCVHFQFTFQCT